LVIRVLTDLTQEIGLKNFICLAELILFDIDRSNIWVIWRFGIDPIGVIEVKKPKYIKDVSPTDDPVNLGQPFDYMYCTICELIVVDSMSLVSL
jgi:hypothetical protein